MMPTAKEAADLALKYGLDLTAAAALARMSFETAEEADVIAAAFADPKPRQLTREDLQGLSVDQINDAREKGQLDSLLKGEE